MTPEEPAEETTTERPASIYLIALYFVLAGFLEAIRKYQESERVFSVNPLAENSLWSLAVDPLITLGFAFLIWRFASLGRLAALVYGYVVLLMYAGIAVSYFVLSTPLHVTPLFLGLAVFHVLSLPFLIGYLQPARRKRLFHVSLWDILVSSD
jgi:hypothetical protein